MKHSKHKKGMAKPKMGNKDKHMMPKHHKEMSGKG